MQVIHTLAELDAKIAECDRLERQSDDALREALGSFRMEVPLQLPADPFSPEYRLAQLDLYERIAGRPYNTGNEETDFDVEAMVRRPFPYYTGSSATAGEYFMAIGFVLKTMALSPASRVLEFGPGWGHTSLWLAQLGHHVTAVDIEPRFCELIERRARLHDVNVETVNDDFFWVERQTDQFDAILFYDCFHHCDDHLRLLRALTRVVSQEGRIFFGAEPIVPDFPQPWGLRLDGWSLWGIRKNGWMELGFRDDYFATALAGTGWFGRKIAVPSIDRVRVWEARHRSTAVFRFNADDPRIRSQVGTRHDGRIEIAAASGVTGLFGPYLDLPAGRYRATIHLWQGARCQGKAQMDVACDGGERVLASKRISSSLLGRKPPSLELEFACQTDLSQVEVRLFCVSDFSAAVESVEISAIMHAPGGPAAS